MSQVQDIDVPSILKTVSSSGRTLFQLLNCIRFAPKVHVQISNEGIRFAVEESRAMQDYDTPPDLPNFQISLPALLETLQIFNAAEAANPGRISNPSANDYTSNIRPGRSNAFNPQSLGISGVCRLSYPSLGSPFGIILEETGVTTTCSLHTYEPEYADEIPFSRDALRVKIIMQSRWLFDAISELSSLSPTTLDITAYPRSPYLSLSASGPLGSASVDFAKGRDLLETFSVGEKWGQSYKFEHVRAAGEAMKLASKVSVRGDEQGVLSCQFMIEIEGGGISFVDFRFVPFLSESDEEGEEEGEEEYEEDESGDGHEEDNDMSL
ncbi:Rad1/Rec1/Rad17 [Xylogone sp. PMI_703]|nr:Rad1/Rec1/Rad17 [Xylogone sp. PMI_703]